MDYMVANAYGGDGDNSDDGSDYCGDCGNYGGDWAADERFGDGHYDDDCNGARKGVVGDNAGDCGGAGARSGSSTGDVPGHQVRVY